jgi:hypothetical protein
MLLDWDRVRRDVKGAATEDLLDRLTVFRAGLEPEAVEVIEKELRNRGITAADIASHGERRRGECLTRPNGDVARCTFCFRPALAAGWGWHRLWGLLPLFPRYFYYCREHLPRRGSANNPSV